MAPWCSSPSKIIINNLKPNHRSRRGQLQMSDVHARMEGRNSSYATFMQEPASPSLFGGARRSDLGSDGGVLLGRSEMELQI
jgi:hypothetical protein